MTITNTGKVFVSNRNATNGAFRVIAYSALSAVSEGVLALDYGITTIEHILQTDTNQMRIENIVPVFDYHKFILQIIVDETDTYIYNRDMDGNVESWETVYRNYSTSNYLINPTDVSAELPILFTYPVNSQQIKLNFYVVPDGGTQYRGDPSTFDISIIGP